MIGVVSEFPKFELEKILKQENVFVKNRFKQSSSAPYNVKISDSSNNSNSAYSSNRGEVEKVEEIYEIEEIKNYYIIMDGFGDSLREVHEELDYKFSFKTTA